MIVIRPSGDEPLIESSVSRDLVCRGILASSCTGLSAGEGNQTLAATSDDPTLTQMIAIADLSSDAFWENVDFDASFASALPGSSSPRSSNTVEPAGGSPSGAK